MGQRERRLHVRQQDWLTAALRWGYLEGKQQPSKLRVKHTAKWVTWKKPLPSSFELNVSIPNLSKEPRGKQSHRALVSTPAQFFFHNNNTLAQHAVKTDEGLPSSRHKRNHSGLSTSLYIFGTHLLQNDRSMNKQICIFLQNYRVEQLIYF